MSEWSARCLYEIPSASTRSDASKCFIKHNDIDLGVIFICWWCSNISAFNHSSILISSFQPNSCVIYLKSNDTVLETLRPACLHCWLILNNLQYNILHVHLQSLCWSPVSPHPGKWTHPFGRVLCVELWMSLYSTHTALTHTYFPLNQCFSSEGSLVQCWTVAYINYREMLNHSQLITYLYIIKNILYNTNKKINI